MDENINGSNNSPDPITMKVEDEEVKIYSKEVDGKMTVEKIEYPESRKDDKEWQEKAKSSINLTAQNNKLNLESKKLAEDLKQKTADLQSAKKTLSEMGGKSSNDPTLDLTAGIMKELNLTTPEDLAEADKSDIARATKKVTEAYQAAIVKSTKSSAMTSTMINIIMNENEPAKINEFIQFAGSLKVSPTMDIYKTWKSSQSKNHIKKEVSFDSLAGLQAGHIPFVAVGDSHESLSGVEKIEKGNAEIMLGGLREV